MRALADPVDEVVRRVAQVRWWPTQARLDELRALDERLDGGGLAVEGVSSLALPMASLVEHLQVLAAVMRTAPDGSLALPTVARGAVEAAGVVHVVCDPSVGDVQRTDRYVRLLKASLEDQLKHLDGLPPSGQRLLRKRVERCRTELTLLKAAGAGEAAGVRASGAAARTELVLADTFVQAGSGRVAYSLLSAAAHAQTWGLLQAGRATGDLYDRETRDPSVGLALTPAAARWTAISVGAARRAADSAAAHLGLEPVDLVPATEALQRVMQRLLPTVEDVSAASA